MNHVVLCGRLTANPEIRYTSGDQPRCIARYRLAVDRPRRKGDEQTADFIPCVSFGSTGQFAEKYLTKGTKVNVRGRIQTGSYTDKDGNKRSTFEVVVEEQEFAESKRAAEGQPSGVKAVAPAPAAAPSEPVNDFLASLDEDLDDEDLPFN